MRRIAYVCSLLVIAVACAGSGGPSVRMDEYTVDVPPEIDSGPAKLAVRNVGAIEHELVILRTELGDDDLPVKDAEVQTKAREVELVRKTGRIKSGSSATLSVSLRPGDYVFICNVPGHYQSGMHTAVTAR